MKRFIAVITLAFAVFSMTQPAFARNELDTLVIESTIWGAVAYSENPEIIRDYLNRYPDGLYTDDARQRLDDLEGKQWEAVKDALASKRFSGIKSTKSYEQAYDDLQMKFPDSEFLLLVDQGVEEIRLNMEQRIKERNEAWKEVSIFLLFAFIIYLFIIYSFITLFLRWKHARETQS